MTGPLIMTIVSATTLTAFWHTLERRTRRPVAPPMPALTMPAEPRTDTDLLQLLRAMPFDCAALLEQRGIVLNQQLLCSELPVFVRQSAIRQLLSHVVKIAAHAMQAGGTLKVLARVEGQHAVVHFLDAAPPGQGTALARLFERAAKGLAPRDSAEGGIDACAASCQRLATEHGGRVYTAPAPTGELGITLRVPLCAQITSGVAACM
ncbi:hypothetical protein WKW79_12075 [Variovorax robiniae]|uniref:ATP-binding protein n=1 Tax=Variovorax robiniae TaxID=1836199 RepID=A0ABU8X693_9BURK